MTIAYENLLRTCDEFYHGFYNVRLEMLYPYGHGKETSIFPFIFRDAFLVAVLAWTLNHREGIRRSFPEPITLSDSD